MMHHNIVGRRRLATIMAIAVCCIITAAVIAPPVLGRQSSKPVEFNPDKYKGSMGKITLDYKGKCTLTVKDKKTGKYLLLSTKNGAFKAPVASYDLIQFRAISSDKNKATWIASSLELSKTLTIKANSNIKLSLGPPFTASIAIKAKGRNQVTMDFKLIGIDNARYIINNATRNSKPPAFKVINNKNEIVWQGSFKYG